MHLPGRLRATTLGDLLGTIHRARATGTLELVEDRGRCHRVHVDAGRVVAVEHDGAGPSLADVLRRVHAAEDDVLRRSLLRSLASRRLHGEVLVHEFRLSPTVVGAALRRQLLLRLGAIEQLVDARVAFRVTVPTPRGAVTDPPLDPTEFLHGRRRARARAEAEPRSAPAPGPWEVLGVVPGSDPDEVRRAYRRLVRAVHPDVHPHATDDERRALEVRFAAIVEAYRALVA